MPNVLPNGCVPVMSGPMMLPWMTFACAELPPSHTPTVPLPEIKLPGGSAGSGGKPTDDVIRSAIGVHSYIWIRQNYCSCNVRANKVALYRVIGPTEQVNAATVRGYNVTSIDGCAADEAIRGVHKNASVRVSQRQCARDIGANEVALHGVPSASKRDAVSDVSRDQVARVWRCAANGVVR